MPSGGALFFAEFVTLPLAEQMEYWHRRSEEALTDED